MWKQTKIGKVTFVLSNETIRLDSPIVWEKFRCNGFIEYYLWLRLGVYELSINYTKETKDGNKLL